MSNSNNVVILKGNLFADPKINPTNGGKEVVNIFLATNRPDWRDDEGQWHKRPVQKNNIAVFVPRAIKLLKELKAGDGIEVRASVEIREFVDGDGVVHKRTEIVCGDRYEGHLVKRWAPPSRKTGAE